MRMRNLKCEIRNEGIDCTAIDELNSLNFLKENLIPQLFIIHYSLFIKIKRKGYNNGKTYCYRGC